MKLKFYILLFFMCHIVAQADSRISWFVGYLKVINVDQNTLSDLELREDGFCFWVNKELFMQSDFRSKIQEIEEGGYTISKSERRFGSTDIVVVHSQQLRNELTGYYLYEEKSIDSDPFTGVRRWPHLTGINKEKILSDDTAWPHFLNGVYVRNGALGYNILTFNNDPFGSEKIDILRHLLLGLGCSDISFICDLGPMGVVYNLVFNPTNSIRDELGITKIAEASIMHQSIELKRSSGRIETN